MSCSACQKTIIMPENRLHYTASASFLTGKDGLNYSIMKPLFPPGRQPRGGWGVTLEIKQQKIMFRGTSGQAVFAAVVSTLKTNDITMRALDIWLNLNILWLSRAIDRYQVVSLTRLMELTNPPQQ